MKRILALALSAVLAFSNIVPPVQVYAANEKEMVEIDNNYVQTVDFTTFTETIENDEYFTMLETGLSNAVKYALTTWFNEKKNLDADTGEYYDLKTAGNSTVPEYVYRFPAAQAFGIAVLVKTGEYDPEVIGVDEQTAKEIAIKLAASVAYAHKENGGNYLSWGDEWQAAHWAYYAGYAAWLLWDEMTPEDQEMIKKMVIYEADRFNNKNAVYWKTPNGKELYAGDSKIEEDSWNSELMNLAVQMFPKHENKGIWEYRATEYQLAAFATPAMTKSDEIVHGRPVKEWVYGYNINDNGTVINHGIVHPTYNAASTGVNTSIVNSLVHKPLPLAAKYNLDKLYEGLSKVDFKVSDGYQEPGGTIYREGSYEIYCPQGNDWGGEIYDVYANIDTSAHIYGFEGTEDALSWAKLHLQKVLDQQSRHEDGHTYANTGENSYAGREEAITTRLGCAYMTYWLAKQEPITFENNSVSYPHQELPPLAENEQRVLVSDSTFVRGGSNANNNYYTSDIVEVKNDGGDEGSYTRQAYMKFDFASVDRMPEKVVLNLPIVEVGNAVAVNNVEHVIELVQGNDWAADTMTFATRPDSTGIVLGTWKPNAEGYQLDITEYVQQAMQMDKKLSIRIYSNVNKGGDTWVNYGSERQANPNYIPNAVVTFGDGVVTGIAGDGSVRRSGEYQAVYRVDGLTGNNDYVVSVETDSENFEFLSAEPGEKIEITEVEEISGNKQLIHFSLKEDCAGFDEILKIKLKALSEGMATIKMSLWDDKGTEIDSCIKNVTISVPELNGEFAGVEKEVNAAPAIADTTLRYGYETAEQAKAFGTNTELDCKTYDGVNARQTLIKYSFSELGDISNAETVKVKIPVLRTPNNGETVYRFQAVENTWDEYTVTWNTKPESVKNVTQDPNTMPEKDENTLLETQIPAGASVVEIDVTDYVKRLEAEGKTELSVFIYGLQSSNTSIVLGSRERSDASEQPSIEVAYPVEMAGLTLNGAAETELNATFETLISAEKVKKISDSELELSYDKTMLQFVSAESKAVSVNIEIVENVPGKLRLKFDAETLEDATFDLASVTWKSLREGNTSIELLAFTNDRQSIENTLETTITVMKPVEKTEYTVTVDGEAVETGTYNTKVVLTAEDRENKVFVGWMVNDKIVSSDKEYVFYLANDIAFTKVYADKAETVTVEPEAVLSSVLAMNHATDPKKVNARFVGQLVLPDDCKILEAGLVWATNNTTALDIEHAKVTRIKTISNTNQFSVTINGMPQGKFVRGRVFATIRVGNQEPQTIYSVAGKVTNTK